MYMSSDILVKPKVSILVPTYNRSALLKQSINSILVQSYSNFEIVVVDNNSIDDTEQVIREFADPRIKYFKNPINVGPIRNHNIALSLCRGEYIHMFSDDDLMLENNLSLKVDILDKVQHVGLVHSSINIIDSNGVISSNDHWASKSSHWQDVKSKAIMSGEECYSILYDTWNFISMPTVLVRKSLLDTNNLEFNNQLKYLIDWDLWLKCSLYCDFYFIDNPLVSYRTHNNNETSLIEKSTYELEILLIKVSLLAFNSKLIDKDKNLFEIHQSVIVQLRLLYGDEAKRPLIKRIMRKAISIFGY